VFALYLVYQFWWTDVQAKADQGAAQRQLEQQWSASPSPVPAVHLAVGTRFALLHIPKLGLVVPVAEGTDKEQILDHGLVGHLVGSAMPTDPTGNMVLAGHRNTHGEPFRHLPTLTAGDTVLVETATASYTYTVRGTIPQTAPDNVSVLKAVPAGSPFTRPGHYLTLMTCTPDYTSWYRFVAFAQLTGVRPKHTPQPGPSASPGLSALHGPSVRPAARTVVARAVRHPGAAPAHGRHAAVRPHRPVSAAPPRAVLAHRPGKR
jgi:sortase A